MTYKAISLASTLAMILVVAGHSLPTRFNYQDEFAASLYKAIELIYLFHMPLFFIIAGMKSSSSVKNGFIWKIKDRFKKLILPYIVISSLVIAPKIILSSFAQRPIEFQFESIIEFLIAPWSAPIIFYWFLPTLFICFSLSVIFFKLLSVGCRLKSLKTLLVIIYIMVLLTISITNSRRAVGYDELLNLTGVLHYLFYFNLGVVIMEYRLRGYLIGMTLFFCYLLELVELINFHGHLLVLALCYLCFVIVAYFSKFDVINLRDYYNYPVFLYSFFFQVPVSFLMYMFNCDSISTFLVLLIVGYVGPILLTQIVERFNLPIIELFGFQVKYKN